MINHIHNSIGGIGTEMPDYCAIATLILTHCMNPTVQGFIVYLKQKFKHANII